MTSYRHVTEIREHMAEIRECFNVWPMFVRLKLGLKVLQLRRLLAMEVLALFFVQNFESNFFLRLPCKSFEICDNLNMQTLYILSFLTKEPRRS